MSERLRVELNERTGLGERDERNLERGLFGGGQVPNREGALESCAGMALWRESGNLTMAQRLLRHSSPATTAAYLHPILDDLQAALQALDG